MTTEPTPACCCADWIAGIAREHAGQLAAIARREGLDATAALDVVQDAFCGLLARPDLRVATRDDLARVLHAVVRNAARNLRRRHYRARPHADVDEAALASAEPAPDAVLAHAETSSQLAGCLAGLAEVHRAVVTLRVLEELSGQETAALLGLTANHVGVLLHRAREQLASCMATAQ